MGAFWPDREVSKRLIKELVQGKEMATQLQILLQKPNGEDGSVSAKELVWKIVTSFSYTLSVLSSNSGGGHEVCQNIINVTESSHADHSHCDERSSENSGESKKRSPDFKDGRGCYKRRRSSDTRTVVGPTIEDGNAWRKYGQKDILHAKYPRAYFRCTRKYDQGCRAIKQVQQIQDDPRMFQTTYIGHHTCRNILKAPKMISSTDSDPNWEINYNGEHLGTCSPMSRNMNIPGNGALAGTIKQEDQFKEATPSSDNFSPLMESTHDDHDDMWSDLKGFELSEPASIIGSADNHEDVVSIMYSVMDNPTTTLTTHNLDMDFVVKSIDFDSDFDFDETQFPLGSQL
ncbi:WRKY DNA-binding transcription factor 70 [Ziziphus jujuba]|uniref:WRKY DNA-binding transcription factor 70 n=1 Tax=Ziziphus jujuba TaxID=326968 RepID=A0A6P3YXZ1_ZIZJJ|nr:WRKY DNA-binding transcription factor 70 [Ziziphus jujuba]